MKNMELSYFSIIKLCVQVKNDVDVNKYLEATVHLKRRDENYRSKKSKILTHEHCREIYDLLIIITIYHQYIKPPKLLQPLD